MNNKILFGKYEGKTFEWIIFKDPSYAAWLYNDRIFRQEHFGEEEGAYFRELYRRAWGLTGECPQCNARPITRLGLTWQRNGNLGLVGFYCADCEYAGGSATAYHPAAFYIEAHTLDECEQKRIINEIKRHYIGYGNLTQKKMEEFFHNDANFIHAAPGFFAQQQEEVQEAG